MGGRLQNLAQLRFRWPWLIVGAVVVREVILLTPLNRVEGSQYAYLVALVVIVAWTNWHWRRIPGIWVISLGASLNVLVIAANGARMPVAPELAGSCRPGRAWTGQSTVMGPGTTLNLLGEVVRLWPGREAYSLGDVLIAVGLAIVVFLAFITPGA